MIKDRSHCKPHIDKHDHTEISRGQRKYQPVLVNRQPHEPFGTTNKTATVRDFFANFVAFVFIN